MKITDSLQALYYMISNTGIFHPKEVFKGKRVAIIGAADSIYKEKKGEFIDAFDVVVRINKALHTWKPEDEIYIGKRTDVLFHSFFENEYSGGGPVDFNRFRDFGVDYLVHPNRGLKSAIAHLNFYKRHLKAEKTFMLDARNHQWVRDKLKNWEPTVGFSALASVLNSPCKEVYITGFTFFKTPYAKGYRDQFLDSNANAAHIKKQGLHDPDLEFRTFLELYRNSNCQKVHCDETLEAIIEQN